MTSNYVPQTWHDLPLTDTPISATRLTAIETGIETHVHSGDPAGGDLTGAFPNPSLIATGPGATVVGSASLIPVVTIDAKGRVTALSTAPARFVPTAVKTAGYTAAANDLVLCDTTGGTFAVASPAGPTDGEIFAVKWYAGVAAPTVTGTIDGASGATLLSLGSALTMVYVAALSTWVIY